MTLVPPTMGDKEIAEASAGRPSLRLVSLLVRAILSHPVLPLLVVAFPLFAIFVPYFAGIQNLEDLALESAVLLVMAVGGSLVLLSGNFDLSSEGTLAFTAVLGGWLLATGQPGSGFGLSAFIVIPVMVAVGGIIGAINGALVTIFRVNPFIVTLTTLLTLKGAAALPTHAETVYNLPAAFYSVATASVGGVSFIVVVALIVFVAVALYIRQSVYGRHLYAVGGNPVAAAENGVSVMRVVTVAYIASGALAGVAAWLDAARVQSAAPAIDDGIIFSVFAAMIIGGISLTGGKGNLIGAAGGVLLLSAINNVLNLVALNPLAVNFVRGLVLLLAVLVIIARQRLFAALGLQESAS